MKHILSLLLVFCTILTFGQTTKKAFFIGNSYTAYNIMPVMVNSIAQSRGNTLIHNQRTPDGETLEGHAQAAQTTTLMNSDNWDFVIIQEQSQLGAYPSSAFANNGLIYGTQIANSAKNIGAMPLFYRTWGKKEGDSYFCNIPYATEIYCAYSTMDDAININYRLLAESNQSWLGPVGNVFRYLRTNNPEIELYNPDKSHPSLSGSYVAALTFYTLMFNDNPELVTFDSTLSSANANAIKAAVKQIVYDNMTEWTNVGASDNIISVSAPSAVSQSDLITVQVNYSASVQRDVVVVFQEQNAPFTVYGETRTTVNSGSGFINIDVAIDPGTPLADNAYEFVAYVVPFGQVVSQSLDSGLVPNVTCANNIIPAADNINSVSGPAVVASDQIVSVTVKYDATTSLDLLVFLQDTVGWTASSNSQTITVPAGTNLTTTFSITINSELAASVGKNRWVVQMLPVNGGFSQLIQDKFQNGVDVTDVLDVFDIEIKNKLSIYPNPAANNLNIQLSQPGIIQIFSLEGKLLLDTEVKSTGLKTIDISSLESGLYFVKSVENSFEPVKLVKK